MDTRRINYFRRAVQGRIKGLVPLVEEGSSSSNSLSMDIKHNLLISSKEDKTGNHMGDKEL